MCIALYKTINKVADFLSGDNILLIILDIPE